MRKLKIYLDNCCYNRPYDDQTQLRIELETKAKLFIQQLVVDGKVDLVSSVITEFENNDNPYEIRKFAIQGFLKNAKDAAHLACAVYVDCDYFISTDDRLLRYKDNRIKLINPINFITTEAINYE